MAVILGNAGSVELVRESYDSDFKSTIDPADVAANLNRFSFDFPVGMLLSGDRIDIKSTDGSVLDFVTGWGQTQGSWYVHVDEVGGIRLYNLFDDAVTGEPSGAVDLSVPSKAIPVVVDIRNNSFQCLAQVASFELNTVRDAVDVTELGEEFRQQHSTLISGSGSVTCFFDYRRTICDALGRRVELSVYLHQLLLRLELGSAFKGKFNLVKRGAGTELEDEVWYEFDAFVTNAAIAYEPTQAVQSTIQFVTSGEIKLKTKTYSNLVLQEDFGRIALEDDQEAGFIELEQD